MSLPFRILIVEDNPLTAMNLEAGLNSGEFRVCGVAPDYRKAVQLIKSEKPDLLVVDIELGEGLADGIAVVREMSHIRPVPVIYLTGQTDEAVFEEARETGPAAFLHKPFRIEEVVRQVSLALRNHYGRRRDEISGVDGQLYIPDGTDQKRINIDEIAYLKAEGAYTHLFLLEKAASGLVKSKETVAVNLGNVKKHLPANFYFIPRSYCVNLHFLDRIGARQIQLGPYEVPIPAGSRKELLESLKVARARGSRGKSEGR